MTGEMTGGPDRSNIEDPLSYLPCSAIVEYRKGQIIYDADEPCRHLHLVLEGCVKVSRMSGGTEVVLDFRHADELFGEPALVRGGGERAVALERTKAMSWPADVVQDLVARNLELGIALIQMLAQRCGGLCERVATLSVDSTPRRLAKALLDLGARLGQPDPEQPATLHMAPLSHKLLAQYIGTRREAVTHCMNQFRRDGLVSYSRRGMVVYGDVVREWLSRQYQTHATTPLPLQPTPLQEADPGRWNDIASV